jgi:hypothetical protein
MDRHMKTRDWEKYVDAWIALLKAKASGTIKSILAGAGIHVDQVGDTVTISNTGVLDVTGGAGIAIGGTTADPVVSNTGVLAVGAGAGIAIGGTTADPVVSNTGVLAVGAGAGIALSGAGTDPTISNTGVLALTAGAGIAITGTQADLTITNTAPAPSLTFDETQNNAPVTLAPAAVVVATRTLTFSGTQTIYVWGNCTTKNVSEALVNGGDVTIQLFMDGVPLSATTTANCSILPLMTFGFCGFAYHLTPAAGTHALQLMGASTDNTGALQVQTDQGTLNFLIIG